MSLDSARVSGTKCGSSGSYKERKLRHLGRLREASRQWLKSEENDGLPQRIKATCPRDLSWPSWADAESKVETALHTLLSDAEVNRRHKPRADLAGHCRAARPASYTAVSDVAGNASQTLSGLLTIWLPFGLAFGRGVPSLLTCRLP